MSGGAPRSISSDQPVLAVAILAAAYGVLLTTTNLAGAWRRPAVCAAAALGTGAYIAWRYATADAGLAAGGAQRMFTIMLPHLRDDLCGRVLDVPAAGLPHSRSPPTSRPLRGALRGATLDALPKSTFHHDLQRGVEVLEKSSSGHWRSDYPSSGCTYSTTADGSG